MQALNRNQIPTGDAGLARVGGRSPRSRSRRGSRLSRRNARKDLLDQFLTFLLHIVKGRGDEDAYPPQIGGAGSNTGVSQGTLYPFRIDHDEKFNQTTHLQYTVPGNRWAGGLYGGFNWRFDSGLVAGAVPCYNATSDPNSPCGTFTTPAGLPGVDLSGLTYDEQFEMGLSCDGVKATPYFGFSSCDNAGYKSSLVQIPAPNTENDDHNPPRVAPRNLFDATMGKDNLFHNDHYKWNLVFTAINVTNKYAMYNYLSTFSGTHYVTPRSLTAKITLNF
jgi:hypothetical protein